MNTLSRLAFALLAGTLLVPAACADIIHVDAGAAGDNGGGSWENAFNDLQNALAGAAAGDEIRVAAGVYHPVTPADPGDVTDAEREVSFQLLDEVEIYGGFPAGGGEWGDRDWQTHVTVLSGDIDGNDITDANGVVTDPGDINGANSYHVVNGSGTDESGVLDGFHITAGSAHGASPGDRGGGMFINNGSPTLTNVRFSGNTASQRGGGMYNFNGNPILTDVGFSANEVASLGGGMYTTNGSPTLTNVTFSGNRALAGGGMANENGNPTVTNAAFSGNRADNNGGGMFNSEGDPTLTNVSFGGNRAGVSGGGMRNSSGSNPSLTHTIFWNNRAGDDTDTPSASIANTATSTPAIARSLVANCNPAGIWDDDCGTDGDNNLDDTDPLFIDTPDPADAPTTAGDLRLHPDSPAIDAGDSATDPGQFPGGPGDPVDLDHNPRFAGVAIDLGPYEHQQPLPELTFDPASLHFGEVAVGQAGHRIVTLHNTGASGTVDYVTNGPFLADTEDCGPSLPADSSCPITVVFAPFSTGEVSGSLEVRSSGVVLAVLDLAGTGVAVASDNDIFSDRFEPQAGSAGMSRWRLSGGKKASSEYRQARAWPAF